MQLRIILPYIPQIESVKSGMNQPPPPPPPYTLVDQD